MWRKVATVACTLYLWFADPALHHLSARGAYPKRTCQRTVHVSLLSQVQEHQQLLPKTPIPSRCRRRVRITVHVADCRPRWCVPRPPTTQRCDSCTRQSLHTLLSPTNSLSPESILENLHDLKVPCVVVLLGEHETADQVLRPEFPAKVVVGCSGGRYGVSCARSAPRV